MSRRAPAQLWTAADAAAADRHTMQALGVPSAILMERAALSVSQMVEALASPATRVEVLCGPGNNGGDGVAIARQLAHRGWKARAWCVDERRGAALEEQRAIAAAYGVELLDEIPSAASLRGAWIVDALLGTGSRGAPRGRIAEALERVHALREVGELAGVVAVDLPTGVDADTGVAHALALRADATVTFERSKPGLHTGQGPAFAGRVHVAEIGLLPAPEASRDLALIDEGPLRRGLRGLAEAQHKGQRGHVLVVGGSAGTAGAALLAARAAMRAGAGLGTVVSDAPELGAELLARSPELMRRDFADTPWPGDALVVGPGWTRLDERQSALAPALWRDAPQPAVWDAGGLSLIGEATQSQRVCTPHPKEAAQMLSRLDESAWDVARVQGGRLAAAARLAELCGAIVVLKGVGTVVSDGRRSRICAAGSSALATAGSGDVLAGICGASLARGRAPFEAACEAVLLHAWAGERLAVGSVADEIGAEVASILAGQDAAASGPRWPGFIAS